MYLFFNSCNLKFFKRCYHVVNNSQENSRELGDNIASKTNDAAFQNISQGKLSDREMR